MRHLVTALALASTLAFGGCASNPPPDPGTVPGAIGTLTGAVVTVVPQVQSYAQAACRFVPTAETVLAIFNSSPMLSTVASVADAICAAVTAKAARRGGPAPAVNGVSIHGRFV
jgi:hypothetical protein